MKDFFIDAVYGNSNTYDFKIYNATSFPPCDLQTTTDIQIIAQLRPSAIAIDHTA